MKVQRSVSQVQFSFLPGQTADLSASVWKVERWSEPLAISIDSEVVRKEILRAAYPWEAAGKDNGLGNRLREGRPISVVGVSSRGGVSVEQFPRLWRCKVCSRLTDSPNVACASHGRAWAQLQFVAYHDCGKIETPWVPRCPVHKQVRIRFAPSGSAQDLRFDCPVCGNEVSKGFPHRRCDCGGGQLKYNVHRAASVYTQRSTVVVNPPSEAIAKLYASAGAAERTLAWALHGFVDSTPFSSGPTLASLEAALIAQGVPEPIAKKLAASARDEAGIAIDDAASALDLPRSKLGDAVDSAMALAYAASGGRTTLPQIADSAGPTMRARYDNLYPPAIASAGFSAVDLLPRFPILTAAYGYTRGDPKPGNASLRWFRSDRGEVEVHGHKAETEGLLFRLDPLHVLRWLEARGLLADVPPDAEAVRTAIYREAEVPSPGQVLPSATSLGTTLLTLLHSLSHRAIRRLSAFAGIDRDALAEYLLPLQLCFVVYAAPRGDFVLGGLQALYEHNLDTAIDDIVRGESRCALDPGCSKEGSACVACLHIGEPSCRHYNQFLSRTTLYGNNGYFG